MNINPKDYLIRTKLLKYVLILYKRILDSEQNDEFYLYVNCTLIWNIFNIITYLSKKK